LNFKRLATYHLRLISKKFHDILVICGDGLRVFENRVLRRIFVLKRDEVTGGGTYIIRILVMSTLCQV
jgi:hypothetical protein